MSVIETLREAQRFGFFGPGDIVEAERHARGYVAAIGEVAPGCRIIDLGSGGGLPGLVLADAYPHASILLLDRRQKRTDFLERAVRRHGWRHVAVRLDDVDRLVREVRDGTLPAFDVVTARGFGPPEVTLRAAVAVSRVGGQIVISEPPDRDRWPAELLSELEVTSVRIGPVRLFERH